MALQQNGIYIAIEGIDGSGKSSLLKNLALKLKERNLKVHCTKEPGGSELGKNIRTILQEKPVAVSSKSEFLLFASDRAQHIEEVVKPYLSQNYIILSDRCADSSVVYQGYGRGLDIPMFQMINQWATGNLFPQLTLYVSIDLATAQQRILKRNEAITSFEKEKESFFNNLIKGYQSLYKDRKDVVILDGCKSPDELIQEALNHILRFI